ncbi:MAG: rRNA maturation RNase YbeY [Clostridiales bacterium]|nr:rRNA maturation RNase YbeY [Clostridiales bacterium]
MRILFNQEYAPAVELIDVFEKAAAACIEAESISSDNVEISLSFVSKEEIRELNRVYRKVDKVTDVLSFPLIEDLEELEEWNEEDDGEEILLGDVVICPEKAIEQAKEYRHTKERELVYLFVHSVLHLLGYDHMEEDVKTEMRKREEEIMSFLELERKE